MQLQRTQHVIQWGTVSLVNF